MQDRRTAAGPARWFDWIPSARAQGKSPNEPEPPGGRTAAPSNGSNVVAQQQGRLADNAPPVTRASPDAAKRAEAARTLNAKTPQGKATVSASASGAAAGHADPLLPAASATKKASSAADERPTQARSPSKISDLHSVFFVNASLGWAVGEAGTVLATRDGGSTWVAQTSGTKSVATRTRTAAKRRQVPSSATAPSSACSAMPWTGASSSSSTTWTAARRPP